MERSRAAIATALAVTWGEVRVGARQIFEDTGFEEVSRPTVRRMVMRIDFEQGGHVR